MSTSQQLYRCLCVYIFTRRNVYKWINYIYTRLHNIRFDPAPTLEQNKCSAIRTRTRTKYKTSIKRDAFDALEHWTHRENLENRHRLRETVPNTAQSIHKALFRSDRQATLIFDNVTRNFFLSLVPWPTLILTLTNQHVFFYVFAVFCIVTN